MVVLDPQHPPSSTFISAITVDEATWYQEPEFSEYELGNHLVLAGRFLSKLRNRSWQNNAQSLYFDGHQALEDFVATCTQSIYTQFQSWDEFASFFWAKDAVLKWRLASNY